MIPLRYQYTFGLLKERVCYHTCKSDRYIPQTILEISEVESYFQSAVNDGHVILVISAHTQQIEKDAHEYIRIANTAAISCPSHWTSYSLVYTSLTSGRNERTVETCRLFCHSHQQ